MNPQTQPLITVHGPPPVPSMPVTADRYISENWLARENTELWPKVWQTPK